MGDGRLFDLDEIATVGSQVCPDIANWLDEASSALNAASGARGSAFGDHKLADTWNEFYGLFYECVYETAQNTRAMGAALVEVAVDQENLEAELASSFERLEGDIEGQSAAPTASENFDTAPPSAPSPEADNPFWNALEDDPATP